jgi:hypothetical protein
LSDKPSTMSRPSEPKKHSNLARRTVAMLQRPGVDISTTRLAEALEIKRPTLLYPCPSQGHIAELALDDLLREQALFVIVELTHPMDPLQTGQHRCRSRGRRRGGGGPGDHPRVRTWAGPGGSRPGIERSTLPVEVRVSARRRSAGNRCPRGARLAGALEVRGLMDCPLEAVKEQHDLVPGDPGSGRVHEIWRSDDHAGDQGTGTAGQGL